MTAAMAFTTSAHTRMEAKCACILCALDAAGAGYATALRVRLHLIRALDCVLKLSPPAQTYPYAFYRFYFLLDIY